jgi:hypothetical protein
MASSKCCQSNPNVPPVAGSHEDYLAQNAWKIPGYNVTGFDDRDLSRANFTSRGPFVRFRFKFDQDSVRDAAKWLKNS